MEKKNAKQFENIKHENDISMKIAKPTTRNYKNIYDKLKTKIKPYLTPEKCFYNTEMIIRHYHKMVIQ